MNKTQAKLPFLKFALIPCLIPTMLASLAADTLTWTGDAGNGNWSNTGNWSPAQTPATGDSLIFNNAVQTTQTAVSVALNSVTWGADAGAFTVSGGTLTLNQSGGGLTNNSGLTQSVSSNLTFQSNLQTLDHGSGSLVLGGSGSTININQSLTFEGSGNTSMTGTLVLGTTATFTVNDGTFSLNSPMDASSPAFFIKAGVGTMEFLAANTFSGNFTFNVGGVVIGHDSALGTGNLLMGTSTAARTLTSANGEDRNLANGITLRRALTVEGGGTITFSGATGSLVTSPNVTVGENTTFRIENDLSNSTSTNLTSGGTGTLVLAGDNSGHGGNTTIQGGTLELANTSGAGAGVGILTLQPAATLTGDGLSGNSAVTMNGILSPGANGGQDEGTLTFNPTAGNKVAFGSTSRLELQSGDRIAFDSAGDWLSFASGAELHLLESSWLTGWNTFVLNIDTLPDNIASNLSLSQASIDAGFALDTITPFRIDGTDLQLNLTAIPEARTVLFVLTMVAGALLLRRRRA